MTRFLDTSVLVNFEKSYRRLRALSAEGVELKIPIIAVAEFSRGIHEAGNPALRNRAERFLSRQIASFPLVEFDFESARAWGSLVKALANAGLTMKFGDSLIAAQCLAHDAAVIADDADFDRVPGLRALRLNDLPDLPPA
jgi:predicted nucleic acid-binding protein